MSEIKVYLKENLDLDVKSNYQVFPVEARGVDFVGYVTRKDSVGIRKRLKQNFARKIKRGIVRQSLMSHIGFFKHCDSRNLIKKLLKGEVV